MSDHATLSVLVRIEGRVQGVGYRYWVVSRVGSGKVSGWVRNRRDGSVEALFSGPPDVVNALVNECRVGPVLARVDRVVLTPTDPPLQLGFDCLPTL